MNALNLAFHQHIFYASVQRVVHCHTETSDPSKEHTQHPVSPNPAGNPSNITDTTVSLEGDSNPISVSIQVHTHVCTTTASLGGVITSPQGKTAGARHQSQFLLHVLVTTAALQLLLIKIVAFTTQPLSTTWHRCYHLLAC